MRMNESQPRQQCEMCRRQEMQFHNRAKQLPDDYCTAMAYVPMQSDTTVYDDMKALCQGTLFPCLDKPFKRGCRQ